MSEFIQIAGPLLLMTVVVGVLARYALGRNGVGGVWVWGAVAGLVASLLAAYVISPHDISWHLATSADRVLLTPRVVLLALISIWLLRGRVRSRRPGVGIGSPGHSESRVAPWTFSTYDSRVLPVVCRRGKGSRDRERALC
jgi:hypothetical protein